MPGLLDSQTLLSPQEEGFARSQAMMNAAAQLMKGARYSAVPVSPFETLGEGLQGYTQGYNGAADQLMKREQLRSTIDTHKLALMQMVGTLAAAGLPIPGWLKQASGGDAGLNGFGNIGGGAPGTPAAPGGGMPAPGGGMPPPAYGGGAAPPQPGGPGAPPSAIPSGLLSPNLVGGAPPPLSGGGMPAPAQQGASAAPGGLSIPDVTNVIRTLPAQSRYAVAFKSPLGELQKNLIEKTLTPTDTQKNAAASGKASPFAYDLGLKNDATTTEQKNAEASGGLNPRQLKAAEANDKFTPEEKAASDNGFTTPDGKPDVAGYTTALEARKGVAGEKAKYIGGLIGDVKPAREMTNTLDVMKDALDTAGDKITTGPFANEMLKLKQFAQNAGVPVASLSNAEIVSKLNTVLASQATKQITSRPAVMEFQSFLKANPGLLNSPEGTRKLIDILHQQGTQRVALGKLAMDESNIPKWAQVEGDFYKQHPLISPFTNTPLGERPNLPQGSQFNRKLMQYRDPTGKLYDITGAPVQQ